MLSDRKLNQATVAGGCSACRKKQKEKRTMARKGFIFGLVMAGIGAFGLGPFGQREAQAVYPTFSAGDAGILDSSSGFGVNIKRLQFYTRTRDMLTEWEAGTLPTITSTDGTSWTINAAGTTPRLKLDIGAATGNYVYSIVAPTIGATTSNTLPTDTGKYFALTTNSDGSVTTAGITGTTNASFTVLSGGATAKIKLDTNSATGNFTYSMLCPNLGANTSNSLPTGTAQYFALTANADGSVTTTASTGTSNATFAIATNLILSSVGQTGAHTFTYPDATGVVVTEGASQTLTNKTLTAPTIASFASATHSHQNAAGGGTLVGASALSDFSTAGGNSKVLGTSAAGATAVTGTLTTAGVTARSAADNWDLTASTGTFDSPHGTNTIHGNIASHGNITFDFSGSNTTFKTSTGANTLGGNVIIADGKTLSVGTATGGVANAISLFSATAANGSFVLNQPDNAGNFATVIQPVSTMGQGTTVTIVDPGAATANFVLSEGAATINGVKTFGSTPLFPAIGSSDTSLGIDGKAGAGGVAGGAIVIASGAGHTAAGGGLVSVTGGAGAGAGIGGEASLVGGASAGATGTGGAATITGGAGTAGTAGAVSIDAGAAGGGTGAAVTIGGTNASAVNVGRATVVTRALGTFRADALTSGVSGTAGTFNIYPTTGSKGSIQVQCADNTDDHKLILTNAAVGTSDKTLTLPAVTDTVAVLASSQTLTTKTIDGDDNTVQDLSPAVAKIGVEGATAVTAVPSIPFMLTFTTADAAETVAYTVPVGKKLRVLSMSGYKIAAAGGNAGTLTLKNAGNAITDDISLNVGDKAVLAVTTIDDAQRDLAEGVALQVVTATAAGCHCQAVVNVTGMWVAP